MIWWITAVDTVNLLDPISTVIVYCYWVISGASQRALESSLKRSPAKRNWGSSLQMSEHVTMAKPPPSFPQVFQAVLHVASKDIIKLRLGKRASTTPRRRC